MNIEKQRDELLAALKACADAGEGECNEAWFKAMELARAAISKAEGVKP